MQPQMKKDTIPSYKPACILHVMFLFSFVKIWFFFNIFEATKYVQNFNVWSTHVVQQKGDHEKWTLGGDAL